MAMRNPDAVTRSANGYRQRRTHATITEILRRQAPRTSRLRQLVAKLIVPRPRQRPDPARVMTQVRNPVASPVP